MIRKSSIRKLIELKVHKRIDSILKSYGFIYLKSKVEFKRKVGNFENIFTTQIPIEAIRFDRGENRYILWFELYSYISIPKFDKWFKKNTQNEIRVSTITKKYHGYIKLEHDDLDIEDFFIPSESREFKQEMLNKLIGERPNINHDYVFDLYKSGAEILKNESAILKAKSNIESFLKLDKTVAFNRFHVNFLSIEPYFYFFNKNFELAKKHFKISHSKYISMIPNIKQEYKYELDYFIEFLESFIKDSKEMVGLEYEENIFELLNKIK